MLFYSCSSKSHHKRNSSEESRRRHRSRDDKKKEGRSKSQIMEGLPRPPSFSRKSSHKESSSSDKKRHHEGVRYPFSKFLSTLKYREYFRIETHPNGGALVLHTYQDEINHLNAEEMDELAKEYFKV